MQVTPCPQRSPQPHTGAWTADSHTELRSSRTSDAHGLDGAHPGPCERTSPRLPADPGQPTRVRQTPRAAFRRAHSARPSRKGPSLFQYIRSECPNEWRTACHKADAHRRPPHTRPGRCCRRAQGLNAVRWLPDFAEAQARVSSSTFAGHNRPLAARASRRRRAQLEIRKMTEVRQSGTPNDDGPYPCGWGWSQMDDDMRVLRPLVLVEIISASLDQGGLIFVLSFKPFGRVPHVELVISLANILNTSLGERIHTGQCAPCLTAVPRSAGPLAAAHSLPQGAPLEWQFLRILMQTGD